MSAPCPCWYAVALHADHCCFRGDPSSFAPDKPLPCGHEDPREEGEGDE